VNAVGRTIADRITEAAGRAFVGREAQLEVLGALIEGSSEAVLAFVHGPGGMGKSCLVQVALSNAGPDVRGVLLDCRDIEPTPRGFLRAVGIELGIGGEVAAAEVAAALGGDAMRTVLALDTYETFGLVDAWFRQIFLPSLPENVVCVVAGRDRPSPGWLADPGWAGLVHRIEVRPLWQSEAVRMLVSRGLSEQQAGRINAFARGYPLALELAAAALRADPHLRVEEGPPPHVVSQLLDSLLAWLPSETLPVVEAASTVRRVNEPILRALLDVESARDAFGRLRGLPFVDEGQNGLVLPDVVRDSVARALSPPCRATFRLRNAGEGRGRCLDRLRGFGLSREEPVSA
jgi:hypothetical protein